MRGMICMLCLFVSVEICYAFEPLSGGPTQEEVQDFPMRWNPEWAFETDEQTPPSRCEQLGAKACMCLMSGTCLFIFFWACITHKIRA